MCCFTLVNVARWCALTLEAGLAGPPTSGSWIRFVPRRSRPGAVICVRNIANWRKLWRRQGRNPREAAGPLGPGGGGGFFFFFFQRGSMLRDHCHRPLGTAGP